MVNTGKDTATANLDEKMKETETRSCQAIFSCLRWSLEVCDTAWVDGGDSSRS